MTICVCVCVVMPKLSSCRSPNFPPCFDDSRSRDVPFLAISLFRINVCHFDPEITNNGFFVTYCFRRWSTCDGVGNDIHEGLDIIAHPNK